MIAVDSTTTRWLPNTGLDATCPPGVHLTTDSLRASPPLRNKPNRVSHAQSSARSRPRPVGPGRGRMRRALSEAARHPRGRGGAYTSTGPRLIAPVDPTAYHA